MFPAKNDKVPSELLTLGNQISEHVQSVCCFGADNVGTKAQAKTQYLMFIKAMTVIFLTYKPACLKRLKLTDTNEFDKISDKGFKRLYLYTDSPIFKHGDLMFTLNFSDLLGDSSVVFEWVNTIYPFSEKFKFYHLKPEDFCAHFAFVLSKEITPEKFQKRNGNQKFEVKVEREVKFNMLYEKGCSFENKAFLLEQTIKSVKNIAYYHGVGNCAVMADTAFLNAINSEGNYDVTYLRFTRVKGTVDVLNCIALGNWPEPNCVIVAPWLSINKVFIWNGNISNTPEIKNINQNYDDIKIICRISSNEKGSCNKQLQDAGYAQWLQSGKREHNLMLTEKYAGEFLQKVNNPQKQLDFSSPGLVANK